jgi:nucleoside-diphosphate-sugar epimerase
MSAAGRKMIVFGGNGFVGSRVTQAAIESGWKVIVACRSGAPTTVAASELWAYHAQYVAIDALSRPQVMELLDDHPDTSVIVSCIGALTTDNVDGRRLNGDATINMAAALYERKGIKKLVFVSAADLQPVNLLLKGYYQGKRAAERAMLENIESRSAILRPAFIYGNRTITPPGVMVPLGLLGAPMRAVFQPLHRLIPLSILTPPISVEEVASAAVYACQEPSVTGVHEHKSIVQLASALRIN